MNIRFEEEMSRFEAEIQTNVFAPLFMPSQLRPAMMQSQPAMLMGQTVVSQSPITIAAPPRSTSAVISAPPRGAIGPSIVDDDDVLSTLQKYEAEIKSEKGTSRTASAQPPSQRKALLDSALSSITEVSRNSSGAFSASHASGSGVKASTNASAYNEEPSKKSKKPKRVVRTGGGQVWEDESLKEWDTHDFRIFCGDLGNDVTDEVLIRTFSRYPSFLKAKVVRDKRSNKTKGFGFVSFKDPSDFTRAMKELNGKYVGSRPIKLRKSNWKDRNIEVVRQKQKFKQQMGYKT